MFMETKYIEFEFADGKKILVEESKAEEFNFKNISKLKKKRFQPKRRRRKK